MSSIDRRRPKGLQQIEGPSKVFQGQEILQIEDMSNVFYRQGISKKSTKDRKSPKDLIEEEDRPMKVFYK